MITLEAAFAEALVSTLIFIKVSTNANANANINAERKQDATKCQRILTSGTLLDVHTHLQKSKNLVLQDHAVVIAMEIYCLRSLSAVVSERNFWQQEFYVMQQGWYLLATHWT